MFGNNNITSGIRILVSALAIYLTLLSPVFCSLQGNIFSIENRRAEMDVQVLFNGGLDSEQFVVLNTGYFHILKAPLFGERKWASLAPKSLSFINLVKKYKGCCPLIKPKREQSRFLDRVLFWRDKSRDALSRERKEMYGNQNIYKAFMEQGICLLKAAFQEGKIPSFSYAYDFFIWRRAVAALLMHVENLEAPGSDRYMEFVFERPADVEHDGFTIFSRTCPMYRDYISPIKRLWRETRKLAGSSLQKISNPTYVVENEVGERLSIPGIVHTHSYSFPNPANPTETHHLQMAQIVNFEKSMDGLGPSSPKIVDQIKSFKRLAKEQFGVNGIDFSDALVIHAPFTSTVKNDLFSHMNLLFNKAIAQPLSGSAKKKVFFELVAEVHWLLAHTTKVVRGGGSTAESMVAFILSVKNVPFGGWRPGVKMPWAQAIVMPLDEYKRYFYHYLKFNGNDL